jgi:hypothetical protein
MGRGCEFVASIFAAQRINELCDARIVFVRKQLVQNARLLGCVSFDAAMHKQEVWNLFEQRISLSVVNGRSITALNRCTHYQL